MASLDTPNILGSYLQGAQAGREDRSRKALQDYLQPALAGDQNALSALYKADPEAGMRAQIQGQRMSAQQAEELVRSGDARIAQLGKWARQLTTLPDDLKPGAYQRILPELQKEFPSNWPAQWSPDMAQKAQQLADTLNPQAKQDDQFTLSAGAKRFDRNGKLVAEAPFAPANMQQLVTDQGYAAWDPRTGVATPITYGSPQAQRSATGNENERAAQLFQQAYDQAASQGMSDEQASAYAAQQVNGAMQPQPSGGGQQVRPVSKPATGPAAPSGYRFNASGGLEYIPGGPADPASKSQSKGAASEDERKAAGWFGQATRAVANMKSALEKDKNADTPGLIEQYSPIDELGNRSMSSARQQYANAAGSLSEAILRAATGAGVNESEARQKIRELTPQRGDSDAVKRQKLAGAEGYIKDLEARAGRALREEAPSGNSDINSLLDKYR